MNYRTNEARDGLNLYERNILFCSLIQRSKKFVSRKRDQLVYQQKVRMYFLLLISMGRGIDIIKPASRS